MYSKILVPLDGTDFGELAVSPAAELGKCTGAEVILFRVVQNPLRSIPFAVGESEGMQATQEETDRAGAYLRRVAFPLRGKGLTVRCEIDVGEPTSRILAEARKENVDLIVMSTHYQGDLYKLVLGSIAEKVLRATRRPVLLVKPEKVYTEHHHLDEQEIIGR